MEKGRSHGKHPLPPPLSPPRRARGDREHASGASFSASLLDAIYHSLDDDTTTRRSEEKALAPAPAQFWWAGKPKQASDRRRRNTGPAARPRHSGYASSATSSSESTSSYSFSCSSASTTDTESTRRRRSPPPPRRPPEGFLAADGAADDAVLPPSDKAKKKGRPCFPVARLRTRDAAPPSPGPAMPPSPATFACVLKALFTSGRLPRKPKTPTRVPPSHVLPELPQQACTSVTTDANTVERRCVRFCSDSVVRRRVEELVRSLGELEEDDEESDASSDLFELESIAGANGDELPVYGTTSLVANRPIAHGAGF